MNNCNILMLLSLFFLNTTHAMDNNKNTEDLSYLLNQEIDMQKNETVVIKTACIIGLSKEKPSPGQKIITNQFSIKANDSITIKERCLIQNIPWEHIQINGQNSGWIDMEKRITLLIITEYRANKPQSTPVPFALSWEGTVDPMTEPDPDQPTGFIKFLDQSEA